MRGALLVAAIAMLSPWALSGCESSQAKSDRLAKQGVKVLKAKGLTVKRTNPDVKAVETTVLSSADGAAVVAVLRNSSAVAQAKVPISIDVTGAGAKTVFRNDAPGLEPSLVSTPALAPRASLTWVNDQVAGSAPPKAVKVKVGLGRRVTHPLPQLQLSRPTLNVDSVSGVEASGFVVNQSQVEQRQLVISCIARKGGRIVAAGRAQVERLKVGPKKVPYHVFFVGDPRGAQLSVSAPPTVLK